jgi:hypothetical protein
MHMPPALRVRASRIDTEIQIRTPRLVIEFGWIQWPGDVRLAAIAELELGTRAAIGTIDE